MRQKTMALDRVKWNRSGVLSGTAGVVALDRQENEEIVLRFLDAAPHWGSPVREIRMDFNLAEQLQRLLADELEAA
jgi:hypothetical protein